MGKVVLRPRRKRKKVELRDPVLEQVAALAEAEGIELYVVGGYVRDYFLGKKDRREIDFTVIGDALSFAKLVARHFRSKAVIYERFRTAMVPVGKEYRLEFVGTRREQYVPDSRKPIVTEGTLVDDLERRDFTINAIAIAVTGSEKGKVIDLFGGLRDLSKKILRTPKDPLVTFDEDPLRMMRAARFAAQLQFSVDPAIVEAMKRLAERITIVSQERITDEFLKILQAPKPSIGLKLLYTTGLLQFIFPELAALAGVEVYQVGQQEYAHKDVFFHTLQVVDNVAEKSENLWLRFAALVHDIGKAKTKRFIEGKGWTFYGHEEVGARMLRRIFRTLKLPMDHLEYVQKLVRLHHRPMALVQEEVTDSAIRRLIVQAGDALEDLFLLCRADITSKNPHIVRKYLANYDRVYQRVLEVREKDKLRAFQSPVRGDELIAITGFDPSPAIGFLKKKIEDAILDGIIPNDYEAAKAYLLEHLDEWKQEIEARGIPTTRPKRRERSEASK